MSAKGNPEAVVGLDKLIAETRARLAANPDFVALRALERARAEIVGVKGARPTPATVAQLAPELFEAVPTPELDEPFLRKVSQLAAADKALERVGHPLSAEALMDEAIKEGAVIGGAKPVISFGSSLSKSPKFRSVRWNGEYAWWFSGRPVPSGPSRREARLAAE